jgi:hypothetical protein
MQLSSGDAKCHHELAKLMSDQSTRMRSRGDLVAARSYLDKATAHGEHALARASNDTDLLSTLVQIHGRRGVVEHLLGDDDASRRSFTQAIETAGRLPSSGRHLSLQAAARQDLADLYAKDYSTLAKAQSLYAKVVELYERLIADFPHDPYYRGDFGAVLHNLALTHKKAGEHQTAQELLARASQMQDYAITHKSGNLHYQLWSVKHDLAKGDIARELQTNDQAAMYYQQCIERLGVFAEKFLQHQEPHELLAQAHQKLAQMILGQAQGPGDRKAGKAAEAELRPALALYEKLVQGSPLHRGHQGARRGTYLNLAKSHVLQERWDEATDMVEHLIQEMQSPNPDAPEMHGELGAALSNLALLHLLERPGFSPQPEKAEKLLNEAIQQQSLALQGDLSDWWKRTCRQWLRNHHFLLASTLYDQGKYGPAKQHFEESFSAGQEEHPRHAYYAELLITCPDPTFRDYTAAARHAELAGDLFHAGAANYRLERFTEAQSALEKVLAEHQEHVAAGYYLAMTLHRMHASNDAERQSRQDAAAALYRQTEARRQQQELDPAEAAVLEVLRQEAAAVLGGSES